MFITTVNQKIQTSEATGKTKIILEIEVDNNDFIQDATDDVIMRDMADQYLMVVSAFITNIFHFYKKSPLLATYVLGSTTKELVEKNNYYRDISKQLQ